MLSERLLLPDIEGFGTNCAIGIVVQQVLTRMEVAMDECVNEKEVLTVLGRFESLHLRFSPPSRPT